MATAADMKAGAKRGILVLDLPFRPEDDTQGDFYRADLVFDEVDHSGMSYEVRVYLNNPTADDATPHSLDEGYGGRLVVFGHGGCYGDLGHCDIPTQRTNPFDLRPPHPLTPQTKIVTVTDALNRIMERDGELKTVTLVPYSLNPLRKDRGVNDGLFKFGSVELRTYR